MNKFSNLVLPQNEALMAISDMMIQYQRPFDLLSKNFQSQMRLVNEHLAPYQKQLDELSKSIQSQMSPLRQLTAHIDETLKHAYRPLISAGLANDIQKAMQPTITAWQNLGQLMAEQLKPALEFQIAMRGDLFKSLRTNSLTAAFQSFRLDRREELNSYNDFAETVNELTHDVTEQKLLESDKLDVVVQMLNRIETSVQSLNKPASLKEKLLSFEAISFYISIIFSLLFSLLQYRDQLESDTALNQIQSTQEKLSGGQKNLDARIDTINTKLEMIVDNINKLNQRMCIRDTYIRLRPDFTSRIVTRVSKFEIVIVDAEASAPAHKWLKVKYIDVNSDSIRSGWVLKKYFKKY